MNTIISFLKQNWHRLGLQHLGDADRLSCVFATPRFRASGHVIAFVLARGHDHPLMVAKLPRLPGDNGRLEREAANLQTAQQARPGGFDSIPRVIAFEEFGGHYLLLETAVAGQPMKPAVVRRQPEHCLRTALAWLLEFHAATCSPAMSTPARLDQLVIQPLEQLQTALAAFGEDAVLLEQTRRLCEPLLRPGLPLVLSHEDFSHPNILMTADGNIGVVDWELAEPHGMPAIDLYFFLTYVAFARHNARHTPGYLAAFQQAFFGPRAWALPHIRTYATRLAVPEDRLVPLFVLCWVRYLVGLLRRLQAGQERRQPLHPATGHWLRQNRYYQLWRCAVAHAGQLQWRG
ncbi:MAG: aminoglycoside phosphotransferase family protein [candidate division KSB1 bacterium]|nr:aminoglycoside phosphotransferase family protein [candidate division KSB1 bacterium]MDZ7276154.1 aminoglycoside phosphotransferase family protein [candidate division KSB1 bacterium]MDZ7287066.1 aminoglycoside phosphotransferase family protein [candidate division KSB1 bacterium]MDZ7297009.1 aminoglycoside phosphotransferase family protein [candidate division KSB1 bacterium]MDZ7307515.1 aminoglycoside phosphotransferase family protein [candidate division KSB1 bacterium]